MIHIHIHIGSIVHIVFTIRWHPLLVVSSRQGWSWSLLVDVNLKEF